jgi:hypothetical protein
MPDTVKYEMKFVRNLQNYESAHVTFGVESDVRPGETIDQAKARVVAKVDGWVEEKVNEIDEDARS